MNIEITKKLLVPWKKPWDNLKNLKLRARTWNLDKWKRELVSLSGSFKQENRSIATIALQQCKSVTSWLTLQVLRKQSDSEMSSLSWSSTTSKRTASKKPTSTLTRWKRKTSQLPHISTLRLWMIFTKNVEFRFQTKEQETMMELTKISTKSSDSYIFTYYILLLYIC